MNNTNVTPIPADQIEAIDHHSSLLQVDSSLTTSSSQWHAFLHLDFALTARGVVLKNSAHKGPLYVQKPFYPEGRDLAHVYLLHPPGGMVSGDRLEICTKQAAHSRVLITTPGAGRVYRARPDRTLQHQTNTLIVADHGSMEWLPQEMILYPDAQTRLDTKVELGENAHFIGWEVTSFGLPASGETFDSGSVNQCFQLYQEGRLKIRERLVLNNDNRELLSQLAGMNQQAINGFMIAGPFATNEQESLQAESITNLITELKSHCDLLTDGEQSHSSQSYNEKHYEKNSEKNKQNKPIAGASMTGQYMIIRYLGNDSEQAKKFFIQCWQSIRPVLLDRPACPPRIWAT